MKSRCKAGRAGYSVYRRIAKKDDLDRATTKKVNKTNRAFRYLADLRPRRQKLQLQITRGRAIASCAEMQCTSAQLIRNKRPALIPSHKNLSEGENAKHDTPSYTSLARAREDWVDTSRGSVHGACALSARAPMHSEVHELVR